MRRFFRDDGNQRGKEVPLSVGPTTEERLATIEERLKHVVTFKYLFTAGLAFLGVVTGIIVAVVRLTG